MTRHIRTLRRRLDAIDPACKDAGPIRAVLQLPCNGRDLTKGPGDYRVGDVLLRLFVPAKEASGANPQVAANSAIPDDSPEPGHT